MSYQVIAIAGFIYIIAMPIYVVHLITKSKKVGYLATASFLLGLLIHLIGFVQRYKEMYAINQSLLHSIPITNLYESIVFFVLCLVGGYLFIEWKYKKKALGVFVSTLAGIIISLTDLLGVTKEVQPLVPALKSNWLLAHVTLSFISYAAFAVGFITAALHIVVASESKKSFKYILSTFLLGFMLFTFISVIIDILYSSNPKTVRIFQSTLGNSSAVVSTISWIALLSFILGFWYIGDKIKNLLTTLRIDSDFLEEITYKMIAFGFPIFTIGGLVFGAIWAEQAWGRYWGWDPKETWSLITWFVYAFYLHSKFIRGWRGTKTSIIAVLGFLVTLFTYLGVNLFLSGLHSYGSM
ncbi:MAG: c-type cytochrome biogenesis protein CcsB [Thermodesulfovibrio sp.]|nr:c-type cytochrome biogenesis protein CcsB [Thermodesulfovibrio sp.]